MTSPGEVTGPSDWSAWRRLAEPLPKLPAGLDRLAVHARAWLGRPPTLPSPWLSRAEAVLEAAARLRAEEDAALRKRLRPERPEPGAPSVREERAAIGVEAIRRCVGIELHPVQVAAGLALSQGLLVELATGEGKTLAAALPAIEAGLSGRGCHVVTVNDYLADRDAQLLAPVLGLLGLSVGAVTAGAGPAERATAYAADVTYATHKELCADFVRDRLALGAWPSLAERLASSLRGRPPGRTVMRGLAHALVDEADSVLIDDAVVPLLLSSEGSEGIADDAIRRAREFVSGLEEGRDFRFSAGAVLLTPDGSDRLEAARAGSDSWPGMRRSLDLVSKALLAAHRYRRDEHYVVQEGRVVIVDEATGRLMPDRTWRDGLHQAVEAKEGVAIRPGTETAARSSFQRFFRRYAHLSGMTGTASEAARELREVYGLEILVLPTHAPCLRTRGPDRVFADDEARWRAVVEETARAHERGQPVLIGTRSVRASQVLSGWLRERGLEHRVLNAHSHAEEAAIVSSAGEPSAITVATNMAGRGTDIRLAAGAPAEHGLRVIASEHHGSGRVDRQLFGRAARQGDPGSAVALVSLEDELFQRHGSRLERWGLARFGAEVTPLAGRLRAFWVGRIQARAERRTARRRREMLLDEERHDRLLAFAPLD